MVASCMLSPLVFLLARSTHSELARQVQFLRAENRMLRSRLPRCIHLSEVEKERLVRLGRPLGTAINELISIVHPRTFTRWLRRGQRPAKEPRWRKSGRPPTPAALRELVIRLARENGWGYTRILGELRKLGVGPISRTTVRKILLENGLEPAPRRGAMTWDEFVRAHATTLWSCDFFAKRVWTMTGRATRFVLVFLHVNSRRVIVSEATGNPDGAWMAEQVARFGREAESLVGHAPALVLRDRAYTFDHGFDKALRGMGVEPLRLPIRAPNLNAHIERFIQSIKQECLSRFVVFGDRHLDHLVSEYVAYYHAERPHQGVDNRVLIEARAAGPPEAADVPPGLSPSTKIVCRERLGGVLRHYERVAA